MPSSQDFTEIISSDFLVLYNHTFKSAISIIDTITDYTIDKLSYESANIVINAIGKVTENINNDNHKSKNFRINDALNMTFAKLLYYYFNFGFSFNKRKNKREKPFFYSLFFSCCLLIFYYQTKSYNFYAYSTNIFISASYSIIT